MSGETHPVPAATPEGVFSMLQPWPLIRAATVSH